MILKEGQKPNNILFNSKNNILITQYENSYLTVFNTKDLKSYGKIYIPSEDISQFNFIFDNNNTLLITYQINLYIITIKNYKSLTMIYCLIDIPKKVNIFLMNKIVIQFSNSNMGSDKVYSVFSFLWIYINLFYGKK